MAKYCIACGAQLDPSDAFCGMCGERVESGSSAGALSQSAWGGGFAIPGQQGFAQQPSASVSHSNGPTENRFAAEERQSDIALTEVWGVDVTPSIDRGSIAQGGAWGSAGGSSEGFGLADGGPREAAEDSIRAVDLDFSFGERASESDRKKAPKHAAQSEGPVDHVVAERKQDEGFAKAMQVFDDDDADDSLTVVATYLSEDEDEEDASPTVVVARESYILTRRKNGERIELIPPCIVGRGSASDTRIKGNPAISRKHIKAYKEGDLLMVQDLSSTNNTFINGAVLPGMGSAPVKDGDVLTLGDEDFTFSVEM